MTESIRYLGDPRDCYTPREVERGPEEVVNHSEGGRHSHTGRGSSARPSSGSGHGRPGSSTDLPPPARDLQQPLSTDEATDLWRYLLGVDRQSWPARTRVIGAGQPFLPGEMQRDIQNHFRRMSPQNRLVMTVNFVEMIRYLMAEVSNLMHQADFLSNLPSEDMVEVVIEGEEGEGDRTELMQRYLHTGGKDTNEDRWQRCLARLQKELSSQAVASRWANVRRIRQALPACEPWSAAETRREQLRALLVAMLDEVPEGVPVEAANEQWLGSWGNELEFFLPGTLFPLAVVPAPQVDSDSGEVPMDPDGHPPTSTPSLPAAAPEEGQELSEVERTKREIETAACAEREAKLLQSQAAAYQAWEREELERELSRLSRKRGLESCRLTVEASSGSRDKPRTVHSYSLMVPASGEELRITVTAAMVQDPGDAGSGSEKPPDEATSSEGPTVVLPAVTCGAIGLQGMEFADYEKIYKRWKGGEHSLQEVEARYGVEVAELLMTHDLVAEQGGDTIEAMQVSTDGAGMASTAVPSEGLAVVAFGELVSTQLEAASIDLCTNDSAGREGETG